MTEAEYEREMNKRTREREEMFMDAQKRNIPMFPSLKNRSLSEFWNPKDCSGTSNGNETKNKPKKDYSRKWWYRLIKSIQFTNKK